MTVEEFSFQQLLVRRYDIFHLHWAAETIVRHPNATIAGLRSRMMLFLIDLAKLRGTRIVWTFHDKIPHIVVHPAIAQWFQAELLKRIDGYISMCRIGRDIAEECYPQLKECPCAIIPHGHYRGEYPDECDRTSARDRLNLSQESKVILFLGYIAPYKNVPRLIELFRELDDPDAILLVVGRPDLSETGEQVEQAAVGDDRIRLVLKYIADGDLQFYYRAADLVVLPFSEILNSGSALLALSFDCPILVPDQGAMAELQESVGGDWVRVYQQMLTTEILAEHLDWTTGDRSQTTAPLQDLDWAKLSQDTLSFYQQLS